ncbi:hypothetical protein ES332_D06G033500v1 [Gossypium tomentosum]|uniref:Disease resistance protein At4g27190-like leucine-rich repeats domain-containing protein n=1 Tax=Gossypium tomentosum TaxID=34277 RepID=A0A5D2KD47_GOSTO|nr:hypothetical protein ES332_D06G033500v1 [Gossypium tomentosum]
MRMLMFKPVSRLKSCDKLKRLFSSCLAQSLVRFEALVIRHCKELEEIIGDTEVYEEISSSITTERSLCLPRLKAQKIEGCPVLEYVFPIALAQGLPELQRIEIRGCLLISQVFKGDNGIVHRISQSVMTVVDCARLTMRRSEYN